MIRYYNFKQRSAKWHVYRKDKWTGSTAIDLLKGAKTPPDKQVPDNKYMQRGRILEPLAIEAYEHETGNKVAHYGFITNSKYKHAGYSPDGIEPDTIIEVKCVNKEKHDGFVAGRDLDLSWIAQTHFGLVVTELHKIRFILYNPDSDTPLLIIEPVVQQSIIDNLIKRLKETEPTRKPSQIRAAQNYVKNNPDKVRESNYKGHLKKKKRV